MHPIDRAVLELCQGDFHTLKRLRGSIPQGTLYRHIHTLLRLGWLEKSGIHYKTTEAGRRQLTPSNVIGRWDCWNAIYAPIRVVPTAVHRAMAELMFAAIAIRQQAIRPDRHPVFACAGGTLRWKTTLGLFICLALGLDPAVYVVECGCESGKSLTVRRGSDGSLVFKRELLTAPFITLDEFLAADPGVRSTLRFFLSGRRVMPCENEQLTISPVPLLTLNPREGSTLEARVGLSPPQIRRTILANLDAVMMPDLAAMGEQALVASRAHGPLPLRLPTIDCRSAHPSILKLIRGMIQPEAVERVDVHLVEQLCSGMTAWISDASLAIAQVGYDLGLIYETVGWMRPGWIEAVLQFSPNPERRLDEPEETTLQPPPAQSSVMRVSSEQLIPPAPRLSLKVAGPEREPGLPSLVLSDALKGKLVWLAEETGRPVEEVIGFLIRFFRQWQATGTDYAVLQKIVSLAQALEIADVEVASLAGYLDTCAVLARSGRRMEEIPEALRVIDVLNELPEGWDWPMVRAAVQNVARFIRAGITADQITPVLIQHRQLTQFGVNEKFTVTLAEVLNRTGVVGSRQTATLRKMVETSARQVDVDLLEERRLRLITQVAQLEKDHCRLTRTLAEKTARIDSLTNKEQEVMGRVAAIETDLESHTDELGALRALRAFLLRKTPDVEAFFADMDRLQQYRRLGKAPEPYAVLLSDQVRGQVLTFFQQLQVRSGEQ